MSAAAITSSPFLLLSPVVSQTDSPSLSSHNLLPLNLLQDADRQLLEDGGYCLP